MKVPTTYCVTGDTDWCSEYCIEDYYKLLASYGIKPTIFATHESPVLRHLINQAAIDIGIHPNLLPGSTQGKDMEEIADNLLALYPETKAFRGHCYSDNSRFSLILVKKGIQYDSNIGLWLQSNITPLIMGLPKIKRYPVFWEDDYHFANAGHSWDFKDFKKDFTSPGLKILDIHPFHIAINSPNKEYYDSVKQHTQTLSKEIIEELRYKGKGARTFLIEFLEWAKENNVKFKTLHEIHQMHEGLDNVSK